MFGWVDRLAAAIYQRGHGLTEVNDRVTEEKRTAIRAVRDAVRDAMTHAEHEREHGRDEDHDAALAAANLAGATVQEVHDDQARQLVVEWRRQFDSIYKDYKKASTGEYGSVDWQSVAAPARPSP